MQRDLFLRFVVGLNGAADTTDFSAEDEFLRTLFGVDTEIRVVPLALAEIGDPTLVVFSELQGRDRESVIGFEVHGSLEHVEACVAKFCDDSGDCGVDFTMFGPKFRVRNTRTHEQVGIMPRPERGTTLEWLTHPEVEVFGIGRMQRFVAGRAGEDVEMLLDAV